MMMIIIVDVSSIWWSAYFFINKIFNLTFSNQNEFINNSKNCIFSIKMGWNHIPNDLNVNYFYEGRKTTKICVKIIKIT